MDQILSFYAKEDLNNGGFQNVVEELVDEGFTYNESIEGVKKYFKLK